MDFPLCEANAQIGYIPAANQQVSFLNKNDWQCNGLHTGAQSAAGGQQRGALLQRSPPFRALGPTLQARLQEREGAQVWPISAGSWALRNKLAYMRLTPHVPACVNRIVFVLNTGDFGAEASSWRCELTHRRTQPTVAL